MRRLRFNLYRFFDSIFVTDLLAILLGACVAYIVIDKVQARNQAERAAAGCACYLGDNCTCPKGACQCGERRLK
jgi:hypothetical protein